MVITTHSHFIILRYDYAERMKWSAIPNIKKLLMHGTAAKYVQPIFPSMSYPSWTTIATGLYAENHGILDNYFYSISKDKYFSVGKIGTVF